MGRGGGSPVSCVHLIPSLQRRHVRLPLSPGVSSPPSSSTLCLLHLSQLTSCASSNYCERSRAPSPSAGSQAFYASHRQQGQEGGLSTSFHGRTNDDGHTIAPGGVHLWVKREERDPSASAFCWSSLSATRAAEAHTLVWSLVAASSTHPSSPDRARTSLGSSRRWRKAPRPQVSRQLAQVADHADAPVVFLGSDREEGVRAGRGEGESS